MNWLISARKFLTKVFVIWLCVTPIYIAIRYWTPLSSRSSALIGWLLIALVLVVIKLRQPFLTWCRNPKVELRHDVPVDGGLLVPPGFREGMLGRLYNQATDPLPKPILMPDRNEWVDIYWIERKPSWTIDAGRD